MKRVLVLTGILVMTFSTAHAEADIKCELSKIGSRDGSTAESQILEIQDSQPLRVRVLPNLMPNRYAFIACQTSVTRGIAALACSFKFPKNGETFKTATEVAGVSTRDLNISIDKVGFFCESKKVESYNRYTTLEGLKAAESLLRR